MKFVVCIAERAGYPHTAAFQEMAESTVYGLRALGRDADLVRGVPQQPSDDEQLIVFGTNLLPRDYSCSRAVLYNLEQAGSPWFTKTPMLELLRRHTVWDYSRKNVAWLAERGVSAVHVPLGYAPELSRIRSVAKDIDVFFYGSSTARRDQILTMLEWEGVNVRRAFGVYGRERDELIARSKIVLNLHCYDAQIFEIARVSYLLANHACVVSEESADVPEKLAGVTFAPFDKIAESCVSLLGDEERRAQLAEDGFRSFSTNYSMTEILREALQ